MCISLSNLVGDKNIKPIWSQFFNSDKKREGTEFSTGICTSTLICQACYSKINSNVLHGEFLSNIHSFSMNFYVTGLFNKILKLNVNFCIWEIRDKERCQKLHNWSNCAQIKINDPLFVPNDENFVFFVKKKGFLYLKFR